MNRNIRLFGIFKVFTKRAFLPLTTIYASQVGGLTVAELGVVAASASIVGLIFETVTGYWADKNGRRHSARIGAALALIGTLFYVFFASFPGILIATVVLTIGYSFLSGSMEALMHDSLVVLKREGDYAKVASRAQSLALIINAGIVALVPLLYPIDKRLPFIVGAVAYGILYYLATLVTEPPRLSIRARQQTLQYALRSVITRHTVFFFVVAGLAIAIAVAPVDFYNLSYITLGLKPEHMGIIYACASVLGAFIGVFIHVLKRLTFRQYATFDLVMNALVMISIGWLQSLEFTIAAFVLNMALWRYQSILYQHYILRVHQTTKYKATLLSVLNNVRMIHETWLVLVFAFLAHQLGLLEGIKQGVWIILLVWPLLMFAIGTFEGQTTNR